MEKEDSGGQGLVRGDSRWLEREMAAKGFRVNGPRAGGILPGPCPVGWAPLK